MPTTPLSQALLELSDAIEQLALALAKQSNEDRETGIRKIAVVTKHFKKIQRQILEQSDAGELKLLIKQKHNIGWLKKFLAQRYIITGQHLNHLRVDHKLLEAARFLAQHYLELEDFYRQLKRHQYLKKDFEMLTNSQSLRYIRQWSEMLHKNKIIDAFALTGNNIDVDVNLIKQATAFINGYWLEILLRGEIARFLREHVHRIDSFDIMAQVRIQKNNTKTSELDVLLMLNEKVYWFECKSGHIGSKYYKRFKKHLDQLQIPPGNAFLLVPEMNMNQAEYVKKQTGMILLYATDLHTQLRQKLLL